MHGRVAGLWVYPVKSMRGQALRTADVETRGVAGDRLYAVRDEAGKFGSGKNTRRFARMEGLALWSARLAGGGVDISPPRGEWLDGLGAEAADRLSAQVGRPVSVTREADIAHFDAAPVHILTTCDLAFLERLSGIEPRAESFRPNLLIETNERSTDWNGQRLRIGSTELHVIAPTERCLMVNVAPDGAGGPDLLRPIAQSMDACFGVYATVLHPGRVSVGDRLVLEG